MILMEPFGALPKTVKLVHLAALGFVAAAVVLLMAPAAYHRIVERGNDTERFHTFASRMVLLALAALAPGFACDVYVVLRKLDFARAAPIAAVAVVVVCYGAWFVAMFALRRTRPAYFGRLLQQRQA
jgi:hypothetical protein